jgi:hypothetical protein
MRRTKEPKPRRGWSHTGVLINQARWIELKQVALGQRRTAAEVLDDAIALYLERVEKEEKRG